MLTPGKKQGGNSKKDISQSEGDSSGMRASSSPASQGVRPASAGSARGSDVPKPGPDTTHYRKYSYERDRKINDRVAFMPIILGAFEHASNGPHDCYLTTPISNFRLPEVKFGEAQWQRRTWRETNRVRNALAKLRVDPYDAFYVMDAQGAKSLSPFKAVLTAVKDLEKELIDSLNANSANIADNAANLRWMVVEEIRNEYRVMGTDVRKETRHQLRKMIKTVFSERYRRYEKLPFVTQSHHNNEVWNGTDHAAVFHRVGVLSNDKKKAKATYVQQATEQELLNVNIALTSIKRLGDIYDTLIKSLDGGVAADDLLTAVDKAFKGYSLEKAGLTGVPKTSSLSTGALMLDLQKATGTFLWELLLERFEILRSNVFSYFSIITHDNENPEGVSNDKHINLDSAARLTDALMEKAVPACMACLFEKLCPAIESDIMRIDQTKLNDFTAITGYFEILRAEFKITCSRFFKDVRVPPFSDFENQIGVGASTRTPTPYHALRFEVKRAMFDEYVSLLMKNSPNLQCLKIKGIFSSLQEIWALNLGKLDSAKLDRQFVSGTPEDHPLKNYPNKARDVISEVLLKRMGINELESDSVFGVVCKLLYANHCADGAFIALIVNDQNHYDNMNRSRFVRWFYRSAKSPLALKYEYEESDRTEFSDELKEPTRDENSTRESDRVEFNRKYSQFTSDKLLTVPDWISTAQEKSYTTFGADTSKYAALFQLKRGSLPPLTRKNPPKPNPAKAPPAAQENKQKQSQAGNPPKQQQQAKGKGH